MTTGPWSAPATVAASPTVWSLPSTVETRDIQNPVWFAKKSGGWVALELTTLN